VAMPRRLGSDSEGRTNWNWGAVYGWLREWGIR